MPLEVVLPLLAARWTTGPRPFDLAHVTDTARPSVARATAWVALQCVSRCASRRASTSRWWGSANYDPRVHATKHVAFYSYIIGLTAGV